MSNYLRGEKDACISSSLRERWLQYLCLQKEGKQEGLFYFLQYLTWEEGDFCFLCQVGCVGFFPSGGHENAPLYKDLSLFYFGNTHSNLRRSSILKINLFSIREIFLKEELSSVEENTTFLLSIFWILKFGSPLCFVRTRWCWRGLLDGLNVDFYHLDSLELQVQIPAGFSHLFILPRWMDYVPHAIMLRVCCPEQNFISLLLCTCCHCPFQKWMFSSALIF